jgi:cysteinyl-tRNA synthetase
MLQVYNTLTRRKEEFKPRQPNKVGMYVCGVTVYDYCHIGHARTYIAFDVIYRHLRSHGYEVTYVRNITDIDDKIINRAKERGETCHELTEYFTEAMQEDFGALRITEPTLEPRATTHIKHIIAMVEKLLHEGYAYLGHNGDIYFEVKKFKTYGELSNRTLSQLQAGARVQINEDKHDPLDFVLWKRAKPDEPFWESPWGPGRPGWHIECSAMSTECLGDHFDIHGGGSDLLFPHHENELAQSEAATHEKFVNYWLHTGFVNVENEKMSKSKNNFFTIREVLADFDAEVIRYFLLASHYRSPIHYTLDNLVQARAALTRLYLSLRGSHASGIVPAENDYIKRFDEAMDDDFNTAEAIAILFELSKEINRMKENNQQSDELCDTLRHLGDRLGILHRNPDVFLQGVQDDFDHEKNDIENLVRAREKARAEKDWKESDRIRDELAKRGIVLEDTVGGTIWRRG